MFIHLGQIFGAPKSLGAIYGLLFLSPEPLSFDDVARRLQLSGGSVSQGLKTLKALGAVHAIFVPGDRRDYYQAEMRLRHLVAGFLRESVEGHIVNGEERLGHVQQLLEAGPPASPVQLEFVLGRLGILRNWHAQAKVILPALLKILEAAPQ